MLSTSCLTSISVRNNIFKKSFKVMGCHFGPHKTLDHMACIDFADGFGTDPSENPVQKQMDSFLAEEVEFEMPADVVSWKQGSKVNVKDSHAIKIVTRVCKIKDGSEVTLEKTVEMDFSG